MMFKLCTVHGQFPPRELTCPLCEMARREQAARLKRAERDWKTDEMRESLEARGFEVEEVYGWCCTVKVDGITIYLHTNDYNADDADIAALEKAREILNNG